MHNATVNQVDTAVTRRPQRFSTSRLTVARNVRGYSKSALAGALDVAISTLAAYEDGSRIPPDDVLSRLEDLLNFPRAFFFGDDFDLLDESAPSFRSRRMMKADLRYKSLGYGELAVNCVSPELNRRYQLPQVDLLDLSRESPEDAAVILRNHWRLGHYPIPNMVHLLEAKGIEVYWLNEDSSLVDAFSFSRNDKPFVLINIHDRAGDRDRFNAAHELAHLVLHRDKERVEGRDVEAEAYRFSGAFLLPSEGFRNECPRYPVLDQFAQLKQKWGVSVGAMLRRAHDLGVLSEWQYKCGCREITVRGWRKGEPPQIAIPNEESLAHAKIFENLDRKNISPEAFADSVNLPLEDLLTLAPAATKYVPSTIRRIKHLRLI